MTDLVIYGAGGLGRELLCLVRDVNARREEWNFLGFIDDGLPAGTDAGTDGLPVLGDFSWLARRTGLTAALLGIASPSVRSGVFERLRGHPHVFFPSFRHPTALIAPSAVLGEGSAVSAFCVVGPDTVLGRGVFLNWYVSVGHDSVLGDFCSVMPDVSVSGCVNMGPGAFVGAGAKILQGIRIGEDAVVGIGSVVLNDVPARRTVLGNPAVEVKEPGTAAATETPCVLDILSGVLGTPATEDSGGWDSLKTLQIVMALDEAGYGIPLEKIADIRSARDILSLIGNREKSP